MKWEKRGRILDGAPGRPWAVSHAAVPIAEAADDGTVRVYFSSRDGTNRSSTGYATLDISVEPFTVRNLHPDPILSPGTLGAFDDSGAMASWLVRSGTRRFLYYIGWNLGVTVPFRNAVGLAVSDDDGCTFARYSLGPILDRDTCDPFFTASACVMIDGGVWRMWYLSCVGWEVHAGLPRHRYHIKYAESRDGIHWDRTGIVAITFKSHDEYAISRPSVIKDGGVYRMWYSYRGGAYRIGYAESSDGIAWRRADEAAGIDAGPDEWDAEMIEYPYVFDTPQGRYMLYNGNDYGRTGIGLARLSLST